jgi:DNA-directed RNA polymerase alpha subunit
LESYRIDTVGELILRTENDLLSMANFGRSSLDRIIAMLKVFNLELKR